MDQSQANHAQSPAVAPALRRELGLFSAVMLGLGSILGTGVFVSIGLAAGITGPSVTLAIVLAGAVAACNALSSAQLAASHPTSGGTYEYGHIYLKPWLGFSAGWMFLCAKSASAAAAALGFAGYTLSLLPVIPPFSRTLLAAFAILALTVVVLSGIRRSSTTNRLIVTITLAALLCFIFAGIPSAITRASTNLDPFFAVPPTSTRPIASNFLEASALMFVAFTGYSRIATLGEEVHHPRRTIPRAIIITLAVSMFLYVAVSLIGIAAAGSQAFGQSETSQVAPLAAIASGFAFPGASLILSIGAITAMLGVLLNLILGLSRVALAMGRRGDLPAVFSRLNRAQTTPTYSVFLVSAVILGLASVGDLKLAWSFSAFTVLIYYAITNLAAIRLPVDQRLYHPAIAWAGLVGCLSLAFWVEPRIWAAGLALLALGLLARAIFQRS